GSSEKNTGFTLPSHARSMLAPNCSTKSIDNQYESEQPLVPDDRARDRHGHDREPSIRMDAVREIAAGRARMEPLRSAVGVHALHSFSNVGAAARRLARRPPRTAHFLFRRRCV